MPNDSSPSTTFVWRRVKIRRPPEAQQHSASKRHRWKRFSRRDARLPITITVHLRGGPEAWVAVRGRGETNYYPGVTALFDLIADINQLDKPDGGKVAR